MLILSRLSLKALPIYNIRKPEPGELLQEAMGGDPWKVAVASMLLSRTRRDQAETALYKLLAKYPEPGNLAQAVHADVKALVRPCGFSTLRAWNLINFSALYITDRWRNLFQLPGVGLYVADAVGFVCFGCTDFESNDGALHARASARAAAVHHAEAEDQRADCALQRGAVS